MINELGHDVKLKELLTQLNQAKERQDIPQYKHLYRQLLNQEVDIYSALQQHQANTPGQKQGQ